VRWHILFGDDSQNVAVPGGNPLGATDLIDGANRLFTDMWNSDDLNLAAATAAYNLAPNAYQPPLLPTCLFRIYRTVAAPMNLAMLSNDTLTVELFTSAIAYGDTTTPPAGSATIVFPATTKPLNIAQWVALVNAQLAATNVTIGTTFALSSILAFNWSFFPYQQAFLDGSNATIMTVIMLTTNSSAFYVRFIGAWSLLQLLGKPVTGMALSQTPIAPQPICRPNKQKPGSAGMMMGADAAIQQVYPQYATSDPETQIMVGADNAAQLIVAPASQYRGFVDGQANDAFSSSAVLVNGSESWVYANLDAEDSHPFHFHLTQGYVQANNPLNSPGLVSAQRGYEPLLYSKDVYGIGPQQVIAFLIKFPNYLSTDTGLNPGVPNLGFMMHCHFAAHVDMAGMMGQYCTFSSRSEYF
jgi:hypothetical protein